MSDQPQTLSIPSLLLLAALSALAVRYFLFSPSHSNSTSGTPGRGNSRTANPADVEQIAQMFPQIPRRDIMWDLQRNGGSVAATTEKILMTGGLERPPPTFQPPIPQAATPSTSRASPAQTTAENIDLIKRYNLSSKLSNPHPASEEETEKQPGWSNSKAERQALLQKRREEMILTARRNMEERERQRSSASS